MKSEAQRVAIAEARGWRIENEWPNSAGSYRWKSPDGEFVLRAHNTKYLPDYLGDLNALKPAPSLSGNPA